MNVRSAPHQFRLFGSRDGGPSEVLLEGAYSLDPASPALQVFGMRKPAPVRSLKLVILSNHGHALYTCLYRLRVFGQAYH